MMRHDESARIFAEAGQYFPGGVNSPVRSFASVGGNPPVIARGRGAILQDADGNRYTDFCQSWGSLILGHLPPPVTRAVRRQLRRGTSFGAVSREESVLARKIRDAMPGLERLRFVNSGTEAVMSALRLARAYTGRKGILSFEGCYHGHADHLLFRAGSGFADTGLPSSPGVPEEAVLHSFSLPYNDTAALEDFFAKRGSELAAVVVEPIAANMGLVLPEPGFLETIQALCRRHGALFVCDEVITGFRVGPGGAQGRLGLEPDLTTLGKIIGGGLPVGAYGGRKEIMDLVAPAGPVYQAGTLSGNPLAMAAGAATLEALDPDVYARIADGAGGFLAAVEAAVRAAGWSLASFGSLFTFFARPAAPRNYGEAQAADAASFAGFFRRVLEAGVYLPPSRFETGFVGAAHSRKLLRRAAENIVRAIESRA